MYYVDGPGCEEWEVAIMPADLVIWLTSVDCTVIIAQNFAIAAACCM